MKKIKFIVFWFILFFIFSINVNASSNTYTRSNNNLLVPKDVIVTSENINAILNTPAVSSSEKIYDFANLLTDAEEKKLFKEINEYINNTTIDAAIVTTRDLRGFSIADYANNFYDYNDFMSDGVAFVIYVGGNEPSIYMANSGDRKGKVFTIYTEKRINQILAYVYKNISAGNYYNACSDYIKILSGYFNINRNTEYVVNNKGNIVKNIPWFEIIILSFTLTFIIDVILYTKIVNNKKVSTLDILDDCVDKSTLMVKNNTSQFINNKFQ